MSTTSFESNTLAIPLDDDPLVDSTVVGSGTDLDGALDTFLDQRTRLFRIAHRITGDIATAEDVVQDAWLRWQRVDRAEIKNPAAFLTTTTTHLAINVIQSAQRRHEAPTESLMAEHVDAADDPTHHAERTVTIEGMLFELMARLSAAELAAYLLRKGFDYPYGDIAALLRITRANARQLVRRAQQRTEGGRRRPVDGVAHELLVAAFLSAARAGALAELENQLAPGTRPWAKPRPQTVVVPFGRVVPPQVA
jgi:RNA polymerase sigma factor (sigma-70 family)